MADANNPFDTPRPRGIRLVQATLRVVVAVQCFGLAAGQLHLHRGAPLADLVATGYEVSSEQLSHFANMAAFGLIAGGVLTLLRPSWPVLLPVLAILVGNAIAPAAVADSPVLWIEAARWSAACAAPAALLLVDFWPPKIKPSLVLSLSAVGSLRAATSLTFFAEGLRGLWHYQQGGELVELMQAALAHGLNRDFSVGEARQLVALSAAISLALALTLLTSRNRPAIGLLAVWGLFLAFCPILAQGSAGYDESLRMIAHAGAPLAVLAFWMGAIRERPPEYLPETPDA